MLRAVKISMSYITTSITRNVDVNLYCPTCRKWLSYVLKISFVFSWISAYGHSYRHELQQVSVFLKFTVFFLLKKEVCLNMFVI